MALLRRAFLYSVPTPLGPPACTLNLDAINVFENRQREEALQTARELDPVFCLRPPFASQLSTYLFTAITPPKALASARTPTTAYLMPPPLTRHSSFLSHPTLGAFSFTVNTASPESGLSRLRSPQPICRSFALQPLCAFETYRPTPRHGVLSRCRLLRTDATLKSNAERVNLASRLVS